MPGKVISSLVYFQICKSFDRYISRQILKFADRYQSNHASRIKAKMLVQKKLHDPKMFIGDVEQEKYFRAFRSSHHRRSIKKVILRNLAKSTGKHLCCSLFFNKDFLLEKILYHRCFSVNSANFLRTPCLRNTSRQLFLSFNNLKTYLWHSAVSPMSYG